MINTCEPGCKFVATKYELGGSFGKSFKGDCYELGITPNFKF
jgi:hypothetical protein